MHVADCVGGRTTADPACGPGGGSHVDTAPSKGTAPLPDQATGVLEMISTQ